MAESRMMMTMPLLRTRVTTRNTVAVAAPGVEVEQQRGHQQ